MMWLHLESSATEAFTQLCSFKSVSCCGAVPRPLPDQGLATTHVTAHHRGYSHVAWRFSKEHRGQFVRAYRQLSVEQCLELFPNERERWRVHRVVEALEVYPTQSIRGVAKLIGMSKTRVYETLRDACAKLEN
ncbi:uncharacterized protein LOC144170431 [Haemaphysalis longicornis]